MYWFWIIVGLIVLYIIIKTIVIVNQYELGIISNFSGNLEIILI